MAVSTAILCLETGVCDIKKKAGMYGETLHHKPTLFRTSLVKNEPMQRILRSSNKK